mgnify:FL=1
MMKTEEEKWRSKIQTAIRKNENLTEEQKEILLNRLSFLDRNDWCSFENIYNRCQNAKIEISEKSEAPYYQKKENILYLPKTLSFEKCAELLLIAGLPKLHYLNQAYIDFVHNQEKSYFFLLFLLCGEDTITGAFTTGNLGMITKSILVSRNWKKAQKLLLDLDDCYRYRHLNDERIEKIVATEDYLDAIWNAYQENKFTNKEFESVYKTLKSKVD